MARRRGRAEAGGVAEDGRLDVAKGDGPRFDKCRLAARPSSSRKSWVITVQRAIIGKRCRQMIRSQRRSLRQRIVRSAVVSMFSCADDFSTGGRVRRTESRSKLPGGDTGRDGYAAQNKLKPPRVRHGASRRRTMKPSTTPSRRRHLSLDHAGAGGQGRAAAVVVVESAAPAVAPAPGLTEDDADERAVGACLSGMLHSAEQDSGRAHARSGTPRVADS